MLLTVGKELKQNIKDQLRGVRHLVRQLGSDEERSRLTKGALPPVPTELDRIMGRTFRAVDGVMTAVESAATPFRSSHSAAPGFRAIEHYVGMDGAVAAVSRSDFIDDLYRVLKLIALRVDDNPLIRTAPLYDIHAELMAIYGGAEDRAEARRTDICAALFLALARHHPLAEPRAACDDAVLRQYAAVSLIFGLTSIDGLPPADAPAIVTDALLMGNARLNVFVEAARTDTETEQLKAVFQSLLSHLA